MGDERTVSTSFSLSVPDDTPPEHFYMYYYLIPNDERELWIENHQSFLCNNWAMTVRSPRQLKGAALPLVPAVHVVRGGGPDAPRHSLPEDIWPAKRRI